MGSSSVHVPDGLNSAVEGMSGASLEMAPVVEKVSAPQFPSATVLGCEEDVGVVERSMLRSQAVTGGGGPGAAGGAGTTDLVAVSRRVGACGGACGAACAVCVGVRVSTCGFCGRVAGRV
jgi:hypothetical protein